MQAITQDRYGNHEVLALSEIPVPSLKQGDVLVRVHAAAVHVGDILMMQGRPRAFRLMTGLGRPRQAVPGFEIAGVVEAVGRGVSGFAPGDEVFGEGSGSLAEYATAKASRLAHKPANLSFVEAAALPVSAITAMMAMRDVAKVAPGQRVLIIGASGGVGSYAVQVAKHLGAEVTAVCSARNVDLVRSLGADHVVDYTVDDVTAGEARYDVILDNVGRHPLRDLLGIASPAAVVMPNSGTGGGEWLGPLVRMAGAFFLGLVRRQSFPLFVAMATTERLEDLIDLIDRGAVRPVIGATYTLDTGVDAVARVETGHASGKTVVEIVPAAESEGASA